MYEGENMPQMPLNGLPQGTQHAQDEQELKTIRSLITASNILGPVSVFIGGVLASTAGLICGFIARSKIKKLAAKRSAVSSDAAKFERSANTALVICGIAFVLNLVFLVVSIIMIMDMINSGEFGKIVAQSIGGTSQGSSTWG